MYINYLQVKALHSDLKYCKILITIKNKILSSKFIQNLILMTFPYFNNAGHYISSLNFPKWRWWKERQFQKTCKQCKLLKVVSRGNQTSWNKSIPTVETPVEERLGTSFVCNVLIATNLKWKQQHINFWLKLYEHRFAYIDFFKDYQWFITGPSLSILTHFKYTADEPVSILSTSIHVTFVMHPCCCQF